MFDKLPSGADALHEWLREHLGLTIPREAIIEGHSAPFAYLCHSFFEHHQPRDALVWANRGGGKTFLGALATALDLAFKPGIEIRILAGSLEQAGRMHEHLRGFFSREPFAPLVEGKMTEKKLRLTNGSRAELLAAVPSCEALDEDNFTAAAAVERRRGACWKCAMSGGA